MPDLVIISGGQTDADQAARRAASSFNIPTGGQLPLGSLTEDGPRSGFAESFGVKEMATADYRTRTEQNVRASDATIWFGSTDTPGARTTLNAIKGMGRPHMLVIPRRGVRPSEVAEWVSQGGFKTLNVSGNRESKAPGVGARVEWFVAGVVRQIAGS